MMKKILISILDSLDIEIKNQGFNLDFPDVLYFVKTTFKEEPVDGSGYTRSNYIVLNVERISKTNNKLKEVIAHELFHILTRHNPDFRKKCIKSLVLK